VKLQFVYPGLLVLLAAIGLGVRVVGLADRPMHADEAVQAAIFRSLWWEGYYTYNPDEFHGPTLPYATVPPVWVAAPPRFAEMTAADFRIVPALFGAGAVLLVWLLRDGVGRTPALIAAALLAGSPAMVYYSRYYIHETLLVFFTLAAIAAGWRYYRTGRLAWCLTAGVSVGLMQATKETSPIVFAAMGGALLATWLWGRFVPVTERHEAEPDPGSPNASRRPLWHLAFGVFTAALVWATLLSSFFTNPRGVLDGLLAYGPWLGRAGGAAPHVQPWHYYLHLLGWWRQSGGPVFSEGVVLVFAAFGMAPALVPRLRLPDGAHAPLVRWLAFTTLFLTAAYSAIPYKTPWCVLGMLQGMILLAGIGVAASLRAMPGLPFRFLLSLVLLAAGAHLGWQSYRASFLLPADPWNPYAYAPTLPDAERLANDVGQLALDTPAGHAAPVKVIWHDGYYWPLPWYLRRLEQVGYWTDLPAHPAAPIVIASPRFDERLTAELDATHLMTGYYGLRPNVLAQLWVRTDVWEAHLRRLGRL